MAEQHSIERCYGYAAGMAWIAHARLRTILENLLGIVVVGWVGWYLWRHRDQFVGALDVRWTHLVAMTLLTLLTWVLNGLQGYAMYEAENLRVGKWESILLGASANFGNHLPMRAGTLVRGRYMKAIHGLRYARFGSIFGVRVVLMVVACALLGLGGVIGLALSGGPLSLELLAGYAALLVVSLVPVMRPLPRAGGVHSRFRRIWNDFQEGFDLLRTRPSTSFKVLALILLQYVAVAGRLAVAFDAVATDVSIFALLLFAPTIGLVSFVAITPGGLGIREALIGYLSLATGTRFDQGLFASSVDRAVLLLVVATFGAGSFLYVWRRIRLLDPAAERPHEA